MNARLDKQSFEIADDTGGITKVDLSGYLRRGSRAIVTLPSSKIRRINIQQITSPSSGFRLFFIDNLRYTVDEGAEYTVSFSAFVPHDNVLAGPTAFCMFNGAWRPPGLERKGKATPSDNARWARDGGLADSSGKKKRNRRRLFFAGDNRDFQPAAPSYRLRQLVTVVPDETVDADGVTEGSLRNLADEARAFAEDAMADGIIDARDDDRIPDDCDLFHQAYRAKTDRRISR